MQCVVFVPSNRAIRGNFLTSVVPGSYRVFRLVDVPIHEFKSSNSDNTAYENTYCYMWDSVFLVDQSAGNQVLFLVQNLVDESNAPGGYFKIWVIIAKASSIISLMMTIFVQWAFGLRWPGII